MAQTAKFGIYVNTKDHKAVRINSPYWFPEGPEWVLVTTDVNATLVRIRELAKEKGLVADPATLTWGTIPLRD